MSFKVTAQPSNLAFAVETEETILEAALKANMLIPYGCQSGGCGACKCTVISGEVEMAPPLPPSLSAEEQAEGIILACQAKVKSDLVINAAITAHASIPPIKIKTITIKQLDRFNDDTMIVQLQLSEGKKLDFEAGQYINFLLKDAAPRSYSIASLPTSHSQTGEQVIELHIRHMNEGKFTTHVFTEMKVGDQWDIKGPLGSFYLRKNSEKPIIFLASGTGFAPVKGILEEMHHNGSPRKAVLYWGGRRPKDLYMTQWLDEQVKKMPNLTFVPVVSDAFTEDHWQGRTGMVHKAVMEDYPDLSSYQVYACGTPAMVEAAQNEFIAFRKLPKEEFFMDSFTEAIDV